MNVLSVDDNAALQGSVKRWFALAKEEVPVYRIWCRAGYARGVMDYEEERERERVVDIKTASRSAAG